MSDSSTSATTTTGTPDRAVHVAVASENPCKVRAVQEAFAAALGGACVRVTAAAVASGVREQPVGEAETVRGACTRLRHLARAVRGADYYVALEGGIVATPTCAALVPAAPGARVPPQSGIEYVAVAAGTRAGAGCVQEEGCGDKLRVSVVPTAAFPLPRELSERVVADGEELGPVCDSVFGARDMKRSLGAVGGLTHGQVARGALYVPAVQMALIPFLHAGLAFDLPVLADVEALECSSP